MTINDFPESVDRYYFHFEMTVLGPLFNNPNVYMLQLGSLIRHACTNSVGGTSFRKKQKIIYGI